ncbi:MAG: hypothetical protein JW891_04865 [Candidatus Lokiarchaeota archaeon]|nr:hypothetical protein [Candidatus Lokiarchaeota archaeon]
MSEVKREKVFLLLLLAIVCAMGIIFCFVPSVMMRIGSSYDYNDIYFSWGLSIYDGEIQLFDETDILYRTLPVIIVLAGTVVLIVATIIFISKDSKAIAYLCIIGGALMVAGYLFCMLAPTLYYAVEYGDFYVSVGYGNIMILISFFIPILIGIYVFKR